MSDEDRTPEELAEYWEGRHKTVSKTVERQGREIEKPQKESNRVVAERDEAEATARTMRALAHHLYRAVGSQLS